MKSIIIGGTVITNKESAKNFLKQVNNIIALDTYEAALAINTYEEQLVTTGFLTWEEVESCN